MYSNMIWILINPSRVIVFISYKWIYKHKMGTDGKVVVFKARYFVVRLQAVKKYFYQLQCMLMMDISLRLDYKL